MTDELEEHVVPAEGRALPLAVSLILFAGPIVGAIGGLIFATQGEGSAWTIVLALWFGFVGAVLGAIVAGVTVLALRRLSRR